MQQGSRPRSAASRRGLAGVVLAMTLGLTTMWVTGAPASAFGIDARHEQIVVSDGVGIAAFVAQPNSAGPHPIVVMPSSWGLSELEYTAVALKWAAHGFVVVSYSSRGFGGSQGGEIDIAGERTIADVSEIIDWAIAHAEGDPDRVGTLGISYGGGIGLLAAAHDARIDAVVAMSSWADLAASLYPSETISSSAIDTLISTANSAGNPSQLLRDIEQDIAAGDATSALAITPERSPINDLAALETNGTAIMWTHNWSDGIFPPGQAIDMFERYQGPKKIVLAPGDHGTGEAEGLTGVLPSLQFDNALAWARHHVMGDANVATGPNVVAVDQDSRRQFSAPTWASLTADTEQYYLTEPERSGWWIFRGPEEGDLRSTPSTGWDERLRGGRASWADSPTIAETVFRQLAGSIAAGGFLLGQLPTLWTDGIDRDAAAVWTSGPLGSTRKITGSPELSITVETRESDLTVFAYLYEETPLGFAKLVTHKPYTIRGARSGSDVSIDIELEPIVWEVNRGNRLTLVVDTVDHSYRSETQSRIYLESNHGDAAVLSVPFG